MNPLKAARRMYPIFNRMYFDNELPRIPIFMDSDPATHKGVGAYVQITGRITGIYLCKSITKRNNRLSLPSSLLHEMIHVWQFVKFPLLVKLRIGHGPDFYWKRYQLTKRDAYASRYTNDNLEKIRAFSREHTYSWLGCEYDKQ